MKIKENLKLFAFESSAFICGLLALIFSFTPAYFEADKPDLSLFQLAFGMSDSLSPNFILIMAFILVVIAVICGLALVVLLAIKPKEKIEKITTILAIVSGLFILIGGILLACGLFIQGLTESNSTLGFTQGNWGIKAGNIVVPILALISFILSYPCALVILKRKDSEDKALKVAKK